MSARSNTELNHRIREGLRLEGTFKDGDSTSSLDNLFQGSVTLTVKKMFPDIQRKPTLLHLVPIVSDPVTAHYQNRLDLLFLSSHQSTFFCLGILIERWLGHLLKYWFTFFWMQLWNFFFSLFGLTVMVTSYTHTHTDM